MQTIFSGVAEYKTAENTRNERDDQVGQMVFRFAMAAVPPAYEVGDTIRQRSAHEEHGDGCKHLWNDGDARELELEAMIESAHQTNRKCRHTMASSERDGTHP